MAATTRAHAEAVIAISDVSKHYGAIHAVDGVALDCRRGELFGLIGHNGAGKSTLFKMMLGLIAPTSGRILIDGVAVTGPNFRDVRRKIGYLPENVVLYDNLTGLETLQFFARLKGADREQCHTVLQRVGLAQAAQRCVRDYSKGMRQRLGFAQALLGNPKLLFLDEPTNGLDPEAIRDFYQILQELKAQGTTIILTSHILAEIQQRVDRLAIMVSGRIEASGTVAQLREQMQLPLVFEVSIMAGRAAPIVAALQAITGIAVDPCDNHIHVECPRQRKMEILNRITPFGADVLDINIREASLEDVFFGISK